MHIKFVDIDWFFLCNSYPCVIFESLSHVIKQESHVYSWNLGKIYLVYFLKFWNLGWKGNFFLNFTNKHVITSTNALWILASAYETPGVKPDWYKSSFFFEISLDLLGFWGDVWFILLY